MSNFDWTPDEQADPTEIEEHPKWSWNQIGDSLVGTITKLDRATPKTGFSAGKEQTILTVETAEQGMFTLWVSQAQLRRKLAELAPQAGWKIAITYSSNESLGEGRMMKVFDVAAKPGDSQTVTAPKPSAADLI